MRISDWSSDVCSSDLRAVPVGALTYAMEQETGLKPDTLFTYDLELDEDFRPRITDGEVAAFELWPVEEVARTMRATDDFKFNVNPVNIDFLPLHGLIPPERPDYLALVAGLHQSQARQFGKEGDLQCR